MFPRSSLDSVPRLAGGAWCVVRGAGQAGRTIVSRLVRVQPGARGTGTETAWSPASRYFPGGACWTVAGASPDPMVSLWFQDPVVVAVLCGPSRRPTSSGQEYATGPGYTSTPTASLTTRERTPQ